MELIILETPAFGYDTKLIVAKDCNLVKKKNVIGEKLADYIQDNDIEGVEFVIIENEIDKTTALYKILQKKGTIKECNEKKPFEIGHLADEDAIRVDLQTDRFLGDTTPENTDAKINRV